MRPLWFVLFVLPALATCSLNYRPPAFAIQLDLQGDRAPDLSQMNCFAVVMRRSGLDTVSDAMTGNFPHSCLGLNGAVSNFVTLATMNSGVRMTLTAETHTGEILAFKSPDGNCAGKTVAQLFESIPQVYSVATIPSVAVQDATTIRVSSTYQPLTAVNRIDQCPRPLACTPSGSISCGFDINVTADNFYAVYLADQSGGAARLIMSAPDNDWSTAESMNGATFAANEYLYLAAWNTGFSRAAMFRLMLGSTAFESSASRMVGTVGPNHTSNTTALTAPQLSAFLAMQPTWYSPRYSLANEAGNGFASVVSGMGLARWFWLDSILLGAEVENTEAEAVFYSGADTEPSYVVFRSKCRLIEIANQENGCR